MTKELKHKQLKEERATWVPKALPYSYTIDYHVIPPKPQHETKTFTIGKSSVRHEEEMQKQVEEKRRIKMEEAQKKFIRGSPYIGV